MQQSKTITNIQQNKLLRWFAKLVTYVFHPLFMPIFVVIALFYLHRVGFAGVDDKQKLQWGIIITLNTLFFPALSVFLMKSLGFIESIQLKTMKERIIPLIATMVFYFWAYQLFKSFNAPFLLRVFLLGCFWSIILIFLINIFTKISMHTTAAGGLIGIFIVLMIVGYTNFLIPFLFVLFIAGIIGTARMILQAHTSTEIWLGYLAGFAVQIGAYFFLK